MQLLTQLESIAFAAFNTFFQLILYFLQFFVVLAQGVLSIFRLH